MIYKENFLNDFEIKLMALVLFVDIPRKRIKAIMISYTLGINKY